MKIIVIQKSIFTNCPPIISAVLILNKLGCDVELITIELNYYWKTELDRIGVKYIEIPDKKIPGKIGGVFSYLNFRCKVKECLRNKGENYTLWVEGAHTILSLGRVLKGKRYILDILELHEQHNYQLRAISRVIHQAATVVMPEYNRAVFYKVWFGLKDRPLILPNKPYFTDLVDVDRFEIQYSEKLRIFKNKKVILYQGHIGRERDMSNYIKAIKELGGDFQFVLLGQDHGAMKDYLKVDPNIIHINFIPAPDYLVFTKFAYISVASYTPDTLNNAYCAPNKIWESAKFGLPIIANDIPGLKYTVEAAHAGICVNESNVDCIKEAVLRIESNYEFYRQGAYDFYNSVDCDKIIASIIEGF